MKDKNPTVTVAAMANRLSCEWGASQILQAGVQQCTSISNYQVDRSEQTATFFKLKP